MATPNSFPSPSLCYLVGVLFCLVCTLVCALVCALVSTLVCSLLFRMSVLLSVLLFLDTSVLCHRVCLCPAFRLSSCPYSCQPCSLQPCLVYVILSAALYCLRTCVVFFRKANLFVTSSSLFLLSFMSLFTHIPNRAHA